MSRVEHARAQGANPCPVCWKDHGGPEGHFCADCLTPQKDYAPTQPEAKSAAGGKVCRADGHGCCERIHPTELKLLAGDRGEEW
jgi:hypothetical protein